MKRLKRELRGLLIREAERIEESKKRTDTERSGD